MNTVLSTWSTLEAVRSSVLSGKLGAITSVAAVLAGIMAALALLKVTDDYINGHGVTGWDIVKPLVLLLVVCNFNSFVLTPVNSLVNIFTKSISSGVDVSNQQFITQWGHNIATIGAQNMKQIDDDYESSIAELSQDKSPAGKFFAKLWLGIKKALMNLFSVSTLSIATIIGGLLFLLVKILLFAQQVLCYIYLTVIGLIGPIVFALAIISPYSSGIKSWIARYIQVAMWIPMGYIIMFINLQVGNTFGGMAASGSTGMGAEWFMIALQIVSLASVAAVPKLSAMIIESTGANDAHSSLSQPFRSVARKLIKF